ncbi:MAG: alpha/beta hydrolase [Acidimicrobiia bacterium]|nr:alpha/beta hydrolase [Acidimicrobiia bacterium]
MTATEAPGWFRRAIETSFDDQVVEIEGQPIHYLRWGDAGRPGLVLVHGGGAHAHWWGHIAPLLLGADEYTVVALDLSGHGDSGRRRPYELDLWCREVVGVAADAGIAGPPIVIGHSMGGFVSIATAAGYPDRVAGIVIIDSPVIHPDAEVEAGRRGIDFKKPKIHPDIETAVGRFRTVPAQKNYEPYVMDHVARKSLKEVDGGVTWKFDPAFFGPRRSAASDLLANVSCRVALFRSEYGLVTPDIGAYMYEQMGRVAPVIELPQAGHHPMLDVPLTLVTGLRTLLADWEHSTALPRPG